MQTYPSQKTQPLAIFGGEPAFPAPLHVGRPNIGDREQFMAYAEQMFDAKVCPF